MPLHHYIRGPLFDFLVLQAPVRRSVGLPAAGNPTNKSKNPILLCSEVLSRCSRLLSPPLLRSSLLERSVHTMILGLILSLGHV
ncbi:hypothetical protein CFIMG_008684RA00001 [Ceratocystis fimbriata CBS 114723]|uniref:Uncharacterized protein n=1 Tax=Ceratocystis fimbriata CBS 114723 TaxID=1035309 RepID=A0A2C5X0Q4_9PEZI|nr:hypothetical protein CFIMG_008684RA00001 [Ceratocystis fimbriata CBS 114723]